MRTRAIQILDSEGSAGCFAVEIEQHRLWTLTAISPTEPGSMFTIASALASSPDAWTRSVLQNYGTRDSGHPSDEVLEVTVPPGGDAEILAAQAWLLSRSASGVIRLTTGETYTIANPITLDVGRISLDGQYSTLACAGLAGGAVALTLTNGVEQFAGAKHLRNLHLAGDAAQGRDFNATAIRADVSVAPNSVRVLLDGVRAHDFQTILALGSRAYFMRGINCEFYRARFALSQEAGASDFAENVSFWGSVFYNSDCLLKDLGGQSWRFYGCSFDYHGDPTGIRVTADDRLLDLRHGARAELYGCHFEWKYGHAAGQTNAPIKLRDANTGVSFFGGHLLDAATLPDPLYAALIESDNNSQLVSLDQVRCTRLGRRDNSSKDDCLVIGSDPFNVSGACARVITTHLLNEGTSVHDFPAVPAYHSRAGNFRNGVDDPYTELAFRTAVTGTVVLTNVGTDGGVTPRNAVGQQLKITGQGKAIITLPMYRPNTRHAWAIFCNTSAATGTILIRQRYSTVARRFDNSSVTNALDTRASYAASTVTLSGAVAGWSRVSWKDIEPDTTLSPRMVDELWTIEIDTASMSGGALYIDDFSFMLM